MIFLANVLVMNGGTTFLVRTSREFERRGIPVAIVLLRRVFDSELLSELEKVATIFYLDDFLIDRGRVFRSHLGVFGLVAWGRLERALLPFGKIVHVMGVFGLLFGYRLFGRFDKFKITAGVYHQNEFLYKESKFFFAQKSVEYFCELPSENVLFFNEISRSNYAESLKQDFSVSSVAPIGIELPRLERKIFNGESFRIVSVGNLVEFKTYNEHIIRALPSLLKCAPYLHYDVFGTGPREKYLRDLAKKLGVESVVRFQGEIEYSKLQSALENSVLFVGSGTALIEAAAMGVPALIGIESIETPDTYGFLSDIYGFSYNEDVPYIRKYSIVDLLVSFFESPEIRNSLSVRCQKKASEFSVEKTVDGFEKLEVVASSLTKNISVFALVRMGVSLVFMGISERFLGGPRFSQRRNQSYKTKS